jgi:NADH dehydrogenase [ubiquinone] 1 alpha subcomplex assembly factor 5
MTMHWINELETVFRGFKHTLEPDGLFMSSSLGGDTLQELRICMNLAELERDGGVSPNISPMLSVTDLGNSFARCSYTMPTVDVTHTSFEFTNAFALFEFLRETGE